MEVYYVDLPKRPKAEEHKTFHGAYKALVVENDARNKIIADMVANLCAAGKSTLVLTKQINHGVRLQDLLMERDCDVPFAEGTNELKSEYIKAFNRLDESALIGTVGVLGEGVDSLRINSCKTAEEASAISRILMGGKSRAKSFSFGTLTTNGYWSTSSHV
jgi:superfamily II DNA or RNA helicase